MKPEVPPLTPLARFYSSMESQVQQTLGKQLALEAGALLGVHMAWRSRRGFSSFEDLKFQIAAELVKALDRERNTDLRQKVNELLRFLVTDRQNPLVSLVEDLGEILFLDRERRSEYVESIGGARPYRIRKLLLEYAYFSRQIDAIIGDLTKDFCARSCERLPVGCCRVLGYDLGLVPEVMLQAQIAEAKCHEWQNPPLNRERCQFHTDTGCLISLFKTPACIGFLCDELIAMLRAKHPPLLTEEFISALAEFRNRDIDRKSVFESMQKTIETGQNLLHDKK